MWNSFIWGLIFGTFGMITFYQTNYPDAKMLQRKADAEYQKCEEQFKYCEIFIIGQGYDTDPRTERPARGTFYGG